MKSFLYTLVILIFILPLAYAQIQIVTISPSFNQIAPNTQPVISVTFDQPIDTSSITPISFSVFGERSAYKTGIFSYSTDRTTVSFVSSTSFNAGERVSVNLSRSIHTQSNDTLCGFSWVFRIPSARRNDYFFNKAVVYSGGGFSVQCVDMNQDGYPDIISSGGIIRLNNGAGIFNTVWLLPDADGYKKIVVDDFNRDGIMDVAYRGSNGLKIGIGNGLGNFNFQNRPYLLYNVSTGDFNSDGYPDIVGIYSGGKVFSILFNDGAGYFNDTIVIGMSPFEYMQALESFDVNNDGHLDILCTGWDFINPDGPDGIIVWKGNGKGGFQNPEVYVSNYVFWFPEQLYSSDFSNNGFADIAVFGYRGYVSLNLGGTFGTDPSSTRRFWPPEAPGAINGGDFNGDGWIDLIVSGYRFILDTSAITSYAIVPNCVGIFTNCLPVPFIVSDTLGYGYLSRSVQAVDLDNDGDLDFVNSYSAIYVNINVSPPVSVREELGLPQELYVEQNYPNPFNPVTLINYQLPSDSWVTLKVYDILGREVATLVDGWKEAGIYNVEFRTSNFEISSGIYLYKITAGEFVSVKKMLLAK